MRLVITSDTHGFHRAWTPESKIVPEGDVFIHCGDFSRDSGSRNDFIRFVDWMDTLDFKHKILCPGNHDFFVWTDGIFCSQFCSDHNIHLIDMFNRIEIDGISFDGSAVMPLSPDHDNAVSAFRVHDSIREKAFSNIEPCDVLITHTPPYEILDKSQEGTHFGCPILREKIFSTIKPKLHCFGHVHEAKGRYCEIGTDFLNVSSNTRGMFMRDDECGITTMTMGIRDPIVYEL